MIGFGERVRPPGVSPPEGAGPLAENIMPAAVRFRGAPESRMGIVPVLPRPAIFVGTAEGRMRLAEARGGWPMLLRPEEPVAVDAHGRRRAETRMRGPLRRSVVRDPKPLNDRTSTKPARWS